MIVLVFRTEHVQRLLAPLESLLDEGEQCVIFLLWGAEEGANMPLGSQRAATQVNAFRRFHTLPPNNQSGITSSNPNGPRATVDGRRSATRPPVFRKGPSRSM